MFTVDQERRQMGPYLEAVEDGLPMRPSGPWVAEKLDYLHRYIEMFETSMRQRWPRRCYIDLFAGPGKCRERVAGKIHLGSPLVALTATHVFTTYFLGEKDSNLLDTLRIRCQASPHSDRLRYIDADATTAARQVALEIGTTPSLNFAFLDPNGIELEWAAVEALARVPRMDLLINFSEMGLNREMRNEVSRPGPTALDRFFGGEEWRTVYEEHREKATLDSSLMKLYREKLSGLGYVAVDITDYGVEPLVRNSKEAPLYRLLHASKHPLGHEFWKKVIQRDVSGQRRLF